MKVQFLNQEHQTKFQEIRSEMAEDYRFNKEHLAVVFIMTGDEELYRKMTPYFDTKDGLFVSFKMFAEQDFSNGMGILAKLAAHLFNGYETVSPIDLVDTLDDERLKLAINAILFRRYGLSNSYDLPEEKLYL
ncbi:MULTISPECIES: DUF6075 family protein [Bacillaceae]|uniref:Uncharacterized protein n=1 Tax=Cytobacillus purgationiresistens TaxID=863449 RepID=A0ABU0AJD2_9BACI|nr:DUF6075 family protein [Cytobacillus purgationiresistens]MDQ0271140.1 hypothetical protein [Cytobacillus purgationiresistens]